MSNCRSSSDAPGTPPSQAKATREPSGESAGSRSSPGKLVTGTEASGRTPASPAR